MKTFFGFLLLLHGLIHLMGFAKAFSLAEISQLNQSISRPSGMLWFITTLLLVVATTLYILKNKSWYTIAIIAVFISQLLIISYWKDAKFGTIANLIILLVSIATYGSNRFHKMTQKETLHLIQNIKDTDNKIITKKSMLHLPPIVQQWMQYSGVIGQKRINSVRLKQTGQIRNKPGIKWMRFTAEQYFDANNPSFVWSTKVEANNIFYMLGRDKLTNGKGEMLIKLLGLFNVVDEKENVKIDQGAMTRFLAEICWFPSAALNDYIKWQVIDSTSAKATLVINEQSVSGIFKFTEEGKLLSFQASRYYGGDTNAQLEKWLIEAIEYANFDGYTIPNKCKVTWLLKEGDFNWLQVEITAITYD